MADEYKVIVVGLLARLGGPGHRTPNPRYGVESREPGRQPRWVGLGHHLGDLSGSQFDLHRATEYDLSNTQYDAISYPRW